MESADPEEKVPAESEEEELKVEQNYLQYIDRFHKL
jgi:hypothetical protein